MSQTGHVLTCCKLVRPYMIKHSLLGIIVLHTLRHLAVFHSPEGRLILASRMRCLVAVARVNRSSGKLRPLDVNTQLVLAAEVRIWLCLAKTAANVLVVAHGALLAEAQHCLSVH